MKYKLKFVNKGKPFNMPHWTVGKHKAALATMITECKDMTEEERADEFNYYVIHETLKQIDPDVTIDDIKEMHPEDLVALFNDVYSAGKEGIYDKDFHKGEKTPRKKSTGVKS